MCMGVAATQTAAEHACLVAQAGLSVGIEGGLPFAASLTSSLPLEILSIHAVHMHHSLIFSYILFIYTSIGWS